MIRRTFLQIAAGAVCGVLAGCYTPGTTDCVLDCERVARLKVTRWTGAHNRDFGDDRNWDNGVPRLADDVLFGTFVLPAGSEV